MQFEVPKIVKKTIAIDFDGTIVENAYPGIGRPIPEVVSFIKRHRRKYVWILWTCRTGSKLEDAVEYLRSIGITMDYVNENTKEHADRFGEDSRKVYADYYIDDRNACLGSIKVQHLER